MKYTFLFLTLIGLLSSCSQRLSPFTTELYESYDWNESELQQIQFYLSNDIVLYKEYGNGESTISNGKIKITESNELDEIVFKSGTPGVLLFIPKSNRFAISFEDGAGSDKYLIFGPSKKTNGRFVLLAKDWSRNRGKVTYGNSVYSTHSSSAYASLMVDLKKARKQKHRKDKVGGRVID